MNIFKLLSKIVVLSIFFLVLNNEAQAGPAKIKIIDGTLAPVSQYPYVANLSLGDYICSGTLVGSKYVLTAAHCFFDDNHRLVTNISGYGAILNGTFYSAAKVTVHPAYVSRDEACIDGERDAAVMELTSAPVGIPSIPLQRSVPTVGTSLLLVGFGVEGDGNTGENDTLPPDGYVNYGTTAIESFSDDGSYVNWNFDSGEANTAGGDSGGPAFVDVNGVRYIDSITCGGTDNAEFGTSSSNTRADLIADWVDAVIAGTYVPPTTAPAQAGITLSSVSVNLNENASTILSIKGTVNLGKKFAPNKLSVRFIVDSLPETFKLNSKGAASRKGTSDSFRFSGKLSGGKFPKAAVKFSAALGDTDAIFNDLDALLPVDASDGDTADLPIQMIVKKVSYSGTVTMQYNASTGVWKNQ